MNPPANLKSLETMLRAQGPKPAESHPHVEKLKSILAAIEDYKPKEGRDYKVHLILTGNDMSVMLEGITPAGKQFAQLVRETSMKEATNAGQGRDSGSSPAGSSAASPAAEHAV